MKRAWLQVRAQAPYACICKQMPILPSDTCMRNIVARACPTYVEEWFATSCPHVVAWIALMFKGHPRLIILNGFHQACTPLDTWGVHACTCHARAPRLAHAGIPTETWSHGDRWVKDRQKIYGNTETDTTRHKGIRAHGLIIYIYICCKADSWARFGHL